MPSASPGEFEEFNCAEEPHSQDTEVPFRNECGTESRAQPGLGMAQDQGQDYTVSHASPTHFRVGLAYCRDTHALRLRSDCIAVTAKGCKLHRLELKLES